MHVDVGSKLGFACGGWSFFQKFACGPEMLDLNLARLSIRLRKKLGP